ncbi:acyltransferase family protein [Caulobacter sp. Root1455]|uniref:acyltransferase family protein n=1 Tax=Caulobacter sp. Root1455 TaxID=1736465 RepID=UPI0022864ADE|nr:heparan-alpha-glucosaminide N-acetyltransferase domain-containing protein [Caulobacter sp. Root1455]
MDQRPPRLASLDVLRGLTIVGMIVVNSASYLHYVSGYAQFAGLEHAAWRGFTLADAVFPAFVFMTGASIPLALAARGAPEQGIGGLDGPTLRRLLVRSGRLFLLGLILSNLYWMATPESVPFRPMGVLQRLALCFLAAAVLYKTLGPRARLILAVAILALYWPLTLLPFPDGATDLLKPGANFVGWFDRLVLGGHVYVPGPLGYDPEGLLSTLPAVAQALLGVAAGEWLMAPQSRNGRGALGLLIAGTACIAGGLVWGLAFPISKELWTSSFVLLSTGVALVLLAGLHQALDVEGRRLPGSGFLTDFGINAIFAYSLHMLASIMLTAHLLKIPYVWATPFVGDRAAALIPVAIFVGLIWMVVAYMRKRGWVVKV